MDWTPQRLTELATSYWAPGALLAAVDLGLFDALGASAKSAGQIAAGLRRHVCADRVGALLDALVAVRMVEKSGDGYALSPSARPLLDRGSPSCMLDALAYNADLFRAWATMADTFTRPAIPASRPTTDPVALKRFVHGMESKARVFAPAIASHIDAANARALLDVGAGPGTLSRQLAERSEALQVTLFDLPDVLALAREIGVDSPAADRLHRHPGDYHTDALPSGFDLTLFAGALHQESPAAAQRLAEQFFESLRPGGTVYVIDILLDDDRVAPPFAALFQLNMLLSRPEARVYSGGEISELLSAAGFERPQRVDIPESIYRIVKARKPEVRS